MAKKIIGFVKLQIPAGKANAGLPGIVPDDGPQHIIPDPEGALLDAVLFHLLGQQVAPGDLEFFLVGIAGKS